MTTDPRDADLDAALQRAYATLHRPSTSGHPSEDDWTRFASNEMPADERALLADHLVACTDCAAIFRVVSLISPDAAGAVAPHRPAGADWRLLAAAAAVVLTIGVGWWSVRAGLDGSNQRAAGEPAPASTPRAAATTAEQLPSWASLPAAPTVRLPADLVLTMRGADSDREGFLKRFGAAIAPYRAGQFTEAAAALMPVGELYPDVVEVAFYLGTARLYSGAPAEAIDPLQRAQRSEVVGADAGWLRAVALQRAGRASEAGAALQTLCSESGPYQQRACAVVAP